MIRRWIISKILSSSKTIWIKFNEYFLSTYFLSSSLSTWFLSMTLTLRDRSWQILSALLFWRLIHSILSVCLYTKHFARHVWKNLNLIMFSRRSQKCMVKKSVEWNKNRLWLYFWGTKITGRWVWLYLELRVFPFNDMFIGLNITLVSHL